MKNPFRRTDKEKTTMENDTVKNEQNATDHLEPTAEQDLGTDNADSATAVAEDAGTMQAAELDILRTEH